MMKKNIYIYWNVGALIFAAVMSALPCFDWVDKSNKIEVAAIPIAIYGALMLLYSFAVCIKDILEGTFGLTFGGDAADAEENMPDELTLKDGQMVGYYYEGYVNGIARVARESMVDGVIVVSYSFVDEEGKLITDEFYEYAGSFSENISAPVYRDGLYNLLARDGHLLCEEWYCGMTECQDGKYKVVNSEGLVNYIKSDGSVCWAEWKKELD